MRVSVVYSEATQDIKDMSGHIQAYPYHAHTINVLRTKQQALTFETLEHHNRQKRGKASS